MSQYGNSIGASSAHARRLIDWQQRSTVRSCALTLIRRFRDETLEAMKPNYATIHTILIVLDGRV
jgi:hypothetical protein